MAGASYNAPTSSQGGTPSSIGVQYINAFHIKKALVDMRQEQYFSQLADVENMPKHFGKTINVFQYIPLLDDRNINDQGIDAAGVTISSATYAVVLPNLTTSFAVQADADAAVTAINAILGANAAKSGAGPWIVTVGTTILGNGTLAQANAVVAKIPTARVSQNSGNLYGSSKDIGTITGKLPTLTENGGRVNRVGFTRVMREGTITKFGFFTEFTQESLDFDNDPEVFSHITGELLKGANEITEDVLQKDLLLGAGVVVYAGAATSNGTVTGEGGTLSVVTYTTLMRLSITLDNNRTPKQTKVITGSRMIDTRVISSGRVMYIGSELLPTLRAMVDPFNNAAFIPVSQYADAGTILVGEVGTVDQFRIVVVPEMMYWAGAGAVVGTNAGYRETDGNYDVYPMLVVGDKAFTTIGFQTDGKTVKFKITTKMPGEATADRTDPYGESGFSSIKWYYGTLLLRPERIALVKTIAKI